MQDLIKRIEAADGPSRELDWGIHLRNGLSGVGMYGDHPLYTSSINAAMTLVMKGAYWSVSHGAGGSSFAYVATQGLKHNSGPAKTPALALCAAALRAVMAKNEG